MTQKVMMPAGEYYVGDLCYVMHPQWDEFCDKTIIKHECINGGVTLDNGIRLAQFKTYFGDGVYFDNDGLEYSVDAGLIGCIKTEDIHDDQAWLEGGNIINFEEDFLCYHDDGFIYFGNVCINTKGGEEDEDEDEEY